MKLIKLFILIVISIFIAQIIFSQDESNDPGDLKSNRGIELSVGGGINHSFLMGTFF